MRLDEDAQHGLGPRKGEACGPGGKLREEMLADFMGRRAVDRRWLRRLAKAEPQRFGDFVRGWLDVLGGLIEGLRGTLGTRGQLRGEAAIKNVDRFIADLERAREIALEVFREWGGAAGAQVPAEIAAGAPDATRAASRGPNRRAAAARARRRLDPERDTMLVALAKLGGASRSEVVAEFGLAPEESKITVLVGGLRTAPFRRAGGMSVDLAIESLVEAGYFLGVERGDLRAAFEEAIFSELAGQPVMTAQGLMAEAERAQQEALDAHLDTLDDFDADTLEASGYDAVTEAEQEAAQRLLFLAEQAGLDIEAIQSDAARQTENASQADYLQAVQQLARASLARAGRAAADDAPPAARERDPDRGGFAGPASGRSGRAEGQDGRLTGAEPSGQPYETDLFGQPLPGDDLFGASVQGDRGAPGAARRQERAADPRNLDPAAALPDGTTRGADRAPAGRYATETALVATRQQALGAPLVSSLEDSANALAYLRDSAVERFDAIVTDQAGVPLAVIGGFKGELDSTAVYPSTLLGEAILVPGARRAWLVHNHPSGNPELSEADKSLAVALQNAFGGTRIEVAGMVAVGRDAWTGAAPGAAAVTRGKLAPGRGPTVPAQERRIAKFGKLGPALSGPADAKRVVRDLVVGNMGRPTIVLLDTQLQPVAAVPWAAEDALPMRDNGKLDALVRAVAVANAKAAILGTGGPLTGDQPGMSDAQARNLAAALRRAGARVLDIIDRDGNSEADAGTLTESTRLLSRRSPGAGATPEARALQALAADDELFSYPRGQGQTLEEVARSIDPAVQHVSATTRGNLTTHLLRLPNGTPFSIKVRTNAPGQTNREGYYGVSTQDADPATGRASRPGTPEGSPSDGRPDVILDISAANTGDGGALAYLIAEDFAANTGAVFIGDPQGLSDAALLRRTEQMLSSALKHGSTDHLAPHPRQLAGDPKLGVPPLRWAAGDTLGNIRAMVETVVKAWEHQGSIPVTFELQDGTFRDRSGRVVERDQFTQLARNAGGLGREVKAGGRSVARAAVWRAVLREEGRAGSAGGRRDGLLDRIVRLRDQFPGALSRAFYSRRMPAGQAQAGPAPASPAAPGPATAPAAPAPEPATPDLSARDFEPLAGRRVSLQLRVAETGRTATLSMDARAALREAARRESIFRALLDCMERRTS